ncbi:MAG TPA: beta-propeller fold lactonase family protein, partial [Rhizomicrobium sp.]|nr:beta-propeller fold lactonase family protein [Rhizomicrobium sp.]
MKFLTTVATAALILGSVHAAFAARAYIGTYTKDPAATRGGGNGEGIYLADIDETTGAPSHLRLMVKSLSPSWITLSADHKFLYAVNEIATYGPNKNGSVTAYAVNASTGALKQLNVVDSGGSIPCYVSIHPSGKFLLVANYTGGSYSVIPIKPDGSLGAASDVVKP